MLYLHDIWVNWFEGEENGYNVCYFHEWRKEDKIELLDQVPLLYITQELFDFIENSMHEIPKKLLDKVYKRAYIRKGPMKNELEYACVLTDGNDIVVFDTSGFKIPIRKSRLIPRQEHKIYDMIKHAKQYAFNFKSEYYKKEHHILSMPPHLIYGLTRRERQLKHLLMMSLDQLNNKSNIEELRYWLTEWNPKKYRYLRFMDETEVWDALYNGVKEGWSSSHEEFGKKMIKGQPFLEQMWELEQKQVKRNENWPTLK